MKYSYYDKYINKKTRIRNDITPIFHNPKVFSSLISDMIKPFKKTDFNKVAALDSLGFILGGAIAHKLKVGLVPVRKGGKLPGISGTLIKTAFIDYTGKKKIFEINKNAIEKGDRMLIVDDWIETGSQIKAAIRLIEKQGGKVVGISAIYAEKNSNTNLLFKRYNCIALNLEN